LYLSGIFSKQLCSLLKIIVSLFVVILSVKCLAGDPYSLPAGAKQAGMAQVFVMNNDIWSSFHNQAGFAFNDALAFGFNYHNRFSIKELGTRSAAITIPAGSVSVGAVYSHFGYSDFRRQMIGIASGMSLSDIIAAGVQIDYFSEKTTGEYYNNQMLTCEAGIIIKASENVKIGIHVFNPVPNSLRKSDMPTQLKAGAGVRLNKELSAGVEAEMCTGNKLIIRTGFEYEAAKNLMLRGGFSTENSSFCFGTGFKAGPAMIDFGFASHEKLGITSSVSVTFEMKTINNKKRRM
jgi:hypothetical protein